MAVSGKSRILLDALLDGPKSTEELAELLGTKSVATYVLRLRKALGSPGQIRTTETGYRIDEPRRPEPVFQLPAPVGNFVGREPEISRIGRLLPGDPVVISGPPGVGKSALATSAGHALRERFPDGQLYVNLRGYSPEPPLSAAVVLSRFLRALGVRPDKIPLDQLSSVFRRVVQDSQILVVLDNAASAEQVQPLLPDAPECGVIVTSRDDLDRLGADEVRLDALRPADAERLLAESFGSGEAMSRLAEWCGYYPLALRITVGNLVGRPDVESYVDDLLTEERLQALSVDDDLGVRRAFDRSYAALGPDAAELFGLLGLVPGLDISVEGAGALVGRDAGALLDQLTSANLVQRAGDRFGLHDLLRDYAAEKAGAADDARLRLFQWYLTTAHDVGMLIYPERAAQQPVAVAQADVDTALAWLTAERLNLLAAIDHCARTGPQEMAWQLVDAVGGFLGAQGHGVEFHAAITTAIDAARAAGDRTAEGGMLVWMAGAHRNRGELRRALDLFAEATRAGAAERSPWLPSLQGILHLDLGEVAEARAMFESLAERARELPSVPQLRVSALYGQACADVFTGAIESATAMLREALALAREHGLANLEAACLSTLGVALATAQDFSSAIESLRQALAMRERRGSWHLRAEVLAKLAVVLCDSGMVDEARDTVTRALDAVAELGSTARIEAEVHYAHGVVLRASGTPEETREAFGLALDFAVAAESPYDQMRAHLGLGNAEAARTLATRHGFAVGS